MGMKFEPPFVKVNAELRYLEALNSGGAMITLANTQGDEYGI